MENEKLQSIIESLLFVSGEPLSISRLVKITESSKSEVENAIMTLSARHGEGSGLSLIKKDKSIQLVSNSSNAQYVEKLVKSEIQEALSKAALEVLSIVAYRGSITRMDIEAIRGVNCSFTLRTLMMRGLLEREDNPSDNRSYLYKISFEFIKKLGIESVKKLPDYEKLSQNERIENVVSN